MIRVFAILCLLAGTARAEDAEQAYAAASRLAGDPRTIEQAIAAFEALGAGSPSRWTDNAWSEAARLAERSGQLDRARRAFEQVIATTDDPALRRRARGGLDRLGGARWDAVRREHLALIADSLRGDPGSALEELERLARANPAYPERANVWLAIARGWETEGEPDRAIALLREVSGGAPTGDGRAQTASIPDRDRERVGFALVRIAIRRGDTELANAQLDQLAATAGADRSLIAKLRTQVEAAERRAWIRRAVWLTLLAIGLAGAVVLRRDRGSWRAAGRGLVRPPTEVVFLLPVGGVLVAVAQTGNPVVARALLVIVAAGVIVAWLSAALFEAHRARRGRIGTGRTLAQVVVAIAAVACSAFLAIDRDRLLDLVEETVEHGPAAR